VVGMSGSWGGASDDANGGGGAAAAEGTGAGASSGIGETEVARFARSMSQSVGRSVEDAASTVSRALHHVTGKDSAVNPAASVSSTSLVTLADGASKRLRAGINPLNPLGSRPRPGHRRGSSVGATPLDLDDVIGSGSMRETGADARVSSVGPGVPATLEEEEERRTGAEGERALDGADDACSTTASTGTAANDRLDEVEAPVGLNAKITYSPHDIQYIVRRRFFSQMPSHDLWSLKLLTPCHSAQFLPLVS
jgi:hypothetical protein